MNKKLNNKVNGILQSIRTQRVKSYTTKKDIKMLLVAKENDDYKEIHKSRLYRLHGAEYCQLLELI